ncbi:MAG: glutamate synthase subunit beta, partial [Candidatus Rokuibacteriota bacterium]
MGKVTGFLEIQRKKWPTRPVEERVRDWKEVYLPFPEPELKKQAARCMDCGIPFCHQGCPLGNIIPDWNDLVYKDRWRDAIDRLHATNNFPEWTGRLCPAPCEGSCVLEINDDPVTIKAIEETIIERAFEKGWVGPEPPARRTGKRVAVVGSGPAGLACAQQLNRAGHSVIVFERADRIGGLLRYGIPEFKMEKRFVDRRLRIMEKEGVVFQTGAHVGVNLPVSDLRRDFDAIVLAGGACQPRDLPVPGRELQGIHFAMDYLPLQNMRCEGDTIPDGEFITARDRRVVIMGGGDTGADCLGTVHRQGARSVHQFELLPRPPDSRAPDNPWPQWPNIFRVSSAHEEGGERVYAVSTQRFLGDASGRVRALEAVKVDMVREGGRLDFRPVPASEFTLET